MPTGERLDDEDSAHLRLGARSGPECRPSVTNAGGILILFTYMMMVLGTPGMPRPGSPRRVTATPAGRSHGCAMSAWNYRHGGAESQRHLPSRALSPESQAVTATHRRMSESLPLIVQGLFRVAEVLKRVDVDRALLGHQKPYRVVVEARGK